MTWLNNYTNYTKFIPYIFQGIFLTILLTPIVGKIATKFKILDLPPSMRSDSPDKDRHLEKPPVPLLGGIAVITSFTVLSITQYKTIPNLLWITIPSIILFIMGIIDDVKNLSFKSQLTFQILAAIIFVLSPLEINVLKVPGTNIILNLSQFNHAFTLFGIHFAISLPIDLIIIAWIVIIINALKLNGGTDALLEGNAAITCIITFLLSIRFSSNESAILSALLAGSLIGYGIFNFYPGKIHSGSSGKSVYGFIIATIALISGAKFATTFMATLLPIIDMFFVIAQRVVEAKSLNLSLIMKSGDKRHLHHKLLNLGFTETKVAFIEYGITIAIGIVAALVSGLLKLVLLLTIPLLLIIGILLITIKSSKPTKEEPPQNNSSPEQKYSY